MNLQFNSTLMLLASREEMHRVWGRFDNERPGVSATQILIALTAILLLIVIALVWRAIKRRAERMFAEDSPAKLFRQLCAVHGLNHVHRRLLRQLAETRGVALPAALFVEPGYFDTQKLPPELQPFANELRLLQKRLFA
jgi:hypothetical protein